MGWRQVSGGGKKKGRGGKMGWRQVSKEERKKGRKEERKEKVEIK